MTDDNDEDSGAAKMVDDDEWSNGVFCVSQIFHMLRDNYSIVYFFFTFLLLFFCCSVFRNWVLVCYVCRHFYEKMLWPHRWNVRTSDRLEFLLLFVDVSYVATISCLGTLWLVSLSPFFSVAFWCDGVQPVIERSVSYYSTYFSLQIKITYLLLYAIAFWNRFSAAKWYSKTIEAMDPWQRVRTQLYSESIVKMTVCVFLNPAVFLSSWRFSITRTTSSSLAVVSSFLLCCWDLLMTHGHL